MHLTADGVPVICHNPTVDATSDGKGFIESLPFETLRSFDFGAWKSPAFAGTMLPTLEEFLCLAASDPSLSVLTPTPFPRI